MKRILLSILAVLVLCGVALLAQSSKTPAPAKQKTTAKGTTKAHAAPLPPKHTVRAGQVMSAAAGCTIAKPGRGQICLYDIEQIPGLPPGHPPVYISVGNDESIQWYSGSGRGFHIIRFSPVTAGCTTFPFVVHFVKPAQAGAPWESAVNSGHALQPEVGCEYKPMVRVQGVAQPWDPHIIIGP